MPREESLHCGVEHRDLDLAGARTARQHEPEIRALVTTNKRVAAVWRRVDGRLWLEQALQCVLDRRRVFPEALSGRSFGDAVATLQRTLTRAVAK